MSQINIASIHTANEIIENMASQAGVDRLKATLERILRTIKELEKE